MTTVTLLAAHPMVSFLLQACAKILGPHSSIFEALGTEIQHLTFKKHTVNHKTLHWDFNQITNYVLLRNFSFKEELLVRIVHFRVASEKLT